MQLAPTVNNRLESAVKEYDNIDPRHDNKLNLLDIMSYESKGPEQKQVGQFLAKNFFALSGLDQNDPGHDELSINDLKEAAFYTGLDHQQIEDEQKHIAQEKSLSAIVKPAAAATAVAVGAAYIFGPETLLVTAPVAAVGLVVGSAVAYDDAMHKEKTMQTRANGLHM